MPLAGNCGTPERHNHRRAPFVPMLYCSTAAKGSEGLLGFASLAPLSGPAPTRKNAPISAGPFRSECRPGVIFQPPPPLPSAAGSHPRQRLPDRANPAFNPNFCRYTATLPGPAAARIEWPALGVPPLSRFWPLHRYKAGPSREAEAAGIGRSHSGHPPAINPSTAGERNS